MGPGLLPPVGTATHGMPSICERRGCEATCSFRHFTLHRKKAWRAPTRCSAYIWLRFQYSRETNRTSGPLLTTMRETSQPSTTVAPRVPTRSTFPFEMNRRVEVLHCLFLFFNSGSFVLAGPKTRLFHARTGIAWQINTLFGGGFREYIFSSSESQVGIHLVFTE